MRLILGSGSPRRLELLARLGVTPDEIRAPDIDETPKAGERPRLYCARIAAEKSQAIEVAKGDAVLCADTIVAMGRRILGKPKDADEAQAFLRALSGRRHRVITALVLRTQTKSWARIVVSAVKVKQLSQAEITGYIATLDWVGKAGGYAIQGPAEAFIPWVQGSYSGIVGLPLHETAQVLQAAGIPVWGRQ